jgi:hypothetical protein
VVFVRLEQGGNARWRVRNGRAKLEKKLAKALGAASAPSEVLRIFSRLT